MHHTARCAPQDIKGDILKILQDQLGYARSRDSFNLLLLTSYFLRSNRLVTLSPGYIRWVGDPLKTHVISYDSQHKPTDHRSRVLRCVDGPNLSNSCVSVAFLFWITRISVDQSTFVVALGKFYREPRTEPKKPRTEVSVPCSVLIFEEPKFIR